MNVVTTSGCPLPETVVQVHGRMRSIHLLCFLAVLLYAATAPAGHAQTFYQCLNAQGLAEFSDAPCAPRMRQELDKALSSQTGKPSTGRPPTGLQTGRIDFLACQRARRNFEIAANATRPSMAAVGVRGSAMYGACGMKAPPQVTIIHHPLATHVFRRP